MKKITLLTGILCATIGLFAQSPGGVSGGGTNQLWLDANQLTLSNGSPVSTWTDKSGKGNNATATGTTRPTFKTNQFNGRPAVSFDGVDDRIRTGSVSALNTNTISSFTVFNTATANTSVLFRYSYASGGGDSYLSQFIYGQFYIPSSTQLTYMVRNSASSPPPQRVDKTNYSGGLSMSSQVWNGTTSLDAYYNGTLEGSVAGSNSSPGGSNGVSLGANYNQTPYYMNCSIAEHITYSKALNSAERTILDNYLGAKYGITIGDSKYAYGSTHGYDVIGLGQETDGNNLSAKGISPLGLVAGAISNGEYIIAGHNNVGYAPNITDVPVGYDRYNQVWRAGVTGVPGLVTVTMDVSTYGLGATTAYKLLVDADGVFAAGATEYAGVYSGGTVTFSNVSLTDGVYFTLANTSFQIKSTGVTTDWHTTTTWDCSCIPTASSVVEIKTGNVVNINGQNAASGNLTINGTLTFGGVADTLRILKDLTNNGTLTIGTGVVKMDGTSAQSLTGVMSFYDFIIDNSAGVTMNDTLKVSGVLNVKNGSLTTNNKLTLISNASGTGDLANPTSGSVVGSMKVQRYLNEGTNGNAWYLLCSSVIGGTLEDWNQEFEMQGFTGTEWPGGSSSVYYYDQNNNVTNFNEGYTVPVSTFDVIGDTMGYYIYVGDDSKATGPRVIDMTGTPHLGNVTISAPHIVKIGDPKQDGWTLMGNPYASPVWFALTTKSGAFDAAYWKDKIGNSGLMGNHVLGVGEAFWVHSNSGGASVTFSPSNVVKSHTDQYNLRLANTNLLEVKLDYNNDRYNETFIGFDINANDERVSGEDAYKLPFTDPGNSYIATMVGKNDFQRNILNSNTNTVVPIRIYSSTPQDELKNYTLEINNVKTILNQNKRLILEDRKLNTFTDLKEDFSLPFEMKDNVTEPRFFLHVTSPLNITSKNLTCNSSNDGKIEVNTDLKGVLSYVWKNEKGNVVKQASNSVGTDNLSNLQVGNYTLEVTGKNIEPVFASIQITSPEQISSDFEINYGDINGESVRKNGVLEASVGDEIKFVNNSIGNAQYTWDFGDLAVSSDKYTQHTYFNEGEYNVKLTAIKDKCKVVSNQRVKILPSSNQATNHLYNFNVTNTDNGILVTLNEQYEGNATINVYNSLGQQVYTKNVNVGSNYSQTIQLNKAVGVYMVTVLNNGISKTKKIVLNN